MQVVIENEFLNFTDVKNYVITTIKKKNFAGSTNMLCYQHSYRFSTIGLCYGLVKELLGYILIKTNNILSEWMSLKINFEEKKCVLCALEKC